jgi:hypothetical protein
VDIIDGNHIVGLGSALLIDKVSDGDDAQACFDGVWDDLFLCDGPVVWDYSQVAGFDPE